MEQDLQAAIDALNQGKIIAYPTESTWGLGVDATNPSAVHRLNQLKQRPNSKSFIMLIADLHTVKPWIDWQKLPPSLNPLQDWPGPITKLFPTNSACPHWLAFQDNIALRMSAHPTAKTLCQAFAKPLISTSANTSGQPTLNTAEQIHAHFGNAIALCVPGQPGGLAPTRIINLRNGAIIR